MFRLPQMRDCRIVAFKELSPVLGVVGGLGFEATHGTAPKYANLDKVNPSSLALSGEMLLRYIGFDDAADLVTRGIERAIADKVVTYDFARLMDGASEVSCSGFAKAVTERM